MGSTTAPRLLLAGALMLWTGTPLAAQSGASSAGDTLTAGSAVAVDVRLGGAGGAFDPSAPRPVRRRDTASPPAVLPAAVVHRAPFPVDEAALGAAPRVGEGALLEGALVPLAADGPHPPVGTRLQLWRPGEAGGDRAVGWPVATGTVVADASVRIDRLHDRVRAGDRVRPLPTEPDLAGRRLEAVAAGRRATVLDLPAPRPVVQLGDWVRIALGADADLRPGDEFVPVSGADALGSETRLQIVSVHPEQSIARIVDLGSTSPLPGTVVRLDRRVR